jgi:hypothetical protein
VADLVWSTALDDLPLGAVETIPLAVDTNLSRDSVDAGQVAASGSHQILTVPAGSDIVSYTYTDAGTPAPVQGAAGFVLRAATGLQQWVFCHGRAAGFTTSALSVIGAEFQTVSRPGGEWLAGVLAFDGADLTLYLDGVLAGSWTDMVDQTQMFQLVLNPGDALMWAGVWTGDADWAAVSAQLRADWLGAPALTAVGSWALHGAAMVSEGEPDIPDVPEGTPGGSVIPPEPPEPALPPAGVPDPVLWRVSEIMPSPVLDAHGNPIDWLPDEVVREEVGRLQIVVEGVDITYWDGAPTPVPTWTRTEPFGSQTAVIQLPQITPFHLLPAWCVAGANVDIRLAVTGGAVVQRFSGVVSSFGHRADAGVFTVECAGVVYVSDWQLRTPAFLTSPRDVGVVIADTMNSAVSRRHTEVPSVNMGCVTSVLGGWEPRITGFVQQLLATAVTGGRQWTVKCADRAPVLEQKDTTTVSWSTHNGQRGVTIDLTRDYSQAPNVIFGEGISPDGGRWRNAMFPNWRPDDTPPYPLAPSASIGLGTRDASTTTGSGVSDWQRKVGLPVTGVYGRADRARCLEVQTAAGIQRDGYVGPQTWAATFGTGSNTGTLDCFYLPLAWASNVMPRRYGPDGDDLGPNPAYDPSVLRVEEKIDFGQGVTKAEGRQGASDYLAREINPGWVGTVAFETDPQEHSRYLIDEGTNGIIRGFRGEDLLVHVAQVDYGPDQVTATVDTNARDFPRLDAIRERERNATDPAKAYQKRLNQGSITEARSTFDAESPAGQVPRFALFSNLWSVVRIPFGAYGSVSRTELTTSGPARQFSAAVFDRPITAARLLSVVGNPLTASNNPWSTDEVDQAGLLMSWGWATQPAGYYPGEATSPDGETEAPVTGRLVDDSGWDFASTQPPWLWVAFIAAGGCYVQGRFWPGVD